MDYVTVSLSGDALVAEITCEIDHHAAKAIRERVDAVLLERRPKRLVLDFSGVGFMDSSGIGLVLGRVQKAAEIDCSVCLSGLSDALMRVVRLCGLEKIRNLTIECASV